MKKTVTLLFLTSLLFITIKSFTNGGGPGAGYTNGPGESNCASCHNSSSLNGGAFRNNLNLNGDFTGNGYIPDSTYTITVSYSQPNISKFGFQTMVLDKATASPVGTLTASGTRNQKRTKVVSGKTREYIEHTTAGTAATGTGKTDWSFTWKAPSSNVGDVIFYVVVNATNSNNGTSGDTIYAREFTITPSSLLPTADITASDSVVCAGKPVTFSGSGSGSPTSYIWNFPSGSPTTSASQSQSVTYNFAGTFNVILRTKNSKGESKPDTFKITVKSSPTAAIQGAATRYLCKGDSILLSAQFSANSTYAWSNGKQGQNIYVKDTGDYNVGVTSTNGCGRVSASVKVLYFNPSTTTLSHNLSSDTICSGEPIRLSATGNFDTFYFFKNQLLLGSGINRDFNLNADSTVSYTAKIRDSNGCISEPSNALPVFVKQRLEKPQTFCMDQSPSSVTFSWASNPFYHKGLEVSLDSGKTWQSPSAGNKHVMTGLPPKTKVEVHVRALDDTPCMYSPTAVQVCETGACNSLNAKVSYNNRVCKGELVKVTVNGLAGQKYALRIDNGLPITDTIFEFEPIISKKYSLKIVDSNFLSCPAEEFLLDVTIDQLGQLNLRTQQGANTFCDGDTLEITATSGKDQYTFYVNNTLRKVTFDSFYYSNQFNDKDSVWVIVNQGACSDTSEKIIMTIYPLPVADFTWQRDTADMNKVILKFSAVNQGMSEYLFNFGDGKTSVLSNTANDYSGKEGQTIPISLWVKDFFGCENELTKNIQIPFLNSAGNLKKTSFGLYPSPATQMIYVLNQQGISIEEIQLLDMKGHVLIQDSEKGSVDGINIELLNPGIYIIKVKTPMGIWTSRFVKI